MTESAPTLADITHHQFAACLNQSFRVRLGDTSLETELIQVSPWGSPLPGQRQPFSLTFRGASEPILPQQRIYSVENAMIGTLELFLVPIGPDEQGMCYEAVFS